MPRIQLLNLDENESTGGMCSVEKGECVEEECDTERCLLDRQTYEEELENLKQDHQRQMDQLTTGKIQNESNSDILIIDDVSASDAIRPDENSLGQL